ncbi:ABC transporter substrate-binding protein [Pseudarthrobacter sp. AL07]|uniref:taurine ABC transporter substrate-binding protein n=1 Tax=unclassified Pseudarthrobacter TaxID=2647000 RepID=UPI00249CD9C9|nr:MULTISPECIES: ABC transporter substrate-binding protein [unclassified Pseudarthrobacter]MDI3196264.1 ABC transporter substrate-binding protein [Pseudarthrobacter sp. AL20]MDI3210323.1 ABC transporter substrate-binding protein [Pseudarthrobacter sp. AL07]
MTKLPSGTRRTAVVVAVLAITLSGCGSAKERTAETSSCPFTPDESITATARIAYQHIPNGDLIVKDQRVLEACMPNAKITWNKYDSGGDVVQAFGSNSADLGLIGSSPATKALSAPLNIDMKVVWLHDVIGDAEALVAKDTSVKSITALKGKTIAVPFSSTAHYSLLNALREAGLDSARDVKVINLSPDKMIGAWQSGEVDAAWVWDPTLTQLKAQGTVVTGSGETAKAGFPTFDAEGATSAFVAANPGFMDVWTRSQNYAVELINKDPKAAAVSVAVELGIAPGDVEKQFNGFKYLTAKEQSGPDYFGGKLATNLHKTAEFLHGEGEIAAVGSEQAYTDGLYGASISKVGTK